MPRIREGLTILARSAGPHIAVVEGQPGHIAGIDLAVFNRLPFPVEVDGLHAKIVLGSRIIATFDKVKHLAVAGGAFDWLQLEHDLSDSQAALIRRYPEGQPPSDCVLLQISGELTLRTSFRMLTRDFGIEYRTFVPTAGGTHVVVFDPGSRLQDKMTAVARAYGTPVRRQTGRGEFIGGDTREAGAAAFQRVIAEHEGGR